ncbi:unnamed protein product [Chrysoparadoxa australica]
MDWAIIKKFAKNGLKDVEESDSSHCMVCLNRLVSDENEMLFCEGCDIGVHQKCYGIERIPKGDYYCDRCSHLRKLQSKNIPDKASDIHCELCPNLHGGIKRTTDNRWVHLACAMWARGAKIESTRQECLVDLSDVSIITVEEADKGMGQRCEFCAKKEGYLLGCSRGKDSDRPCARKFHFLCGWFAGAFVHCKTKKGVANGKGYEGYPAKLDMDIMCLTHSEHERSRGHDEQFKLRRRYRMQKDLDPCKRQREQGSRRRPPQACLYCKQVTEKPSLCRQGHVLTAAYGAKADASNWRSKTDSGYVEVMLPGASWQKIHSNQKCSSCSDIRVCALAYGHNVRGLDAFLHGIATGEIKPTNATAMKQTPESALSTAKGRSKRAREDEGQADLESTVKRLEHKAMKDSEYIMTLKVENVEKQVEVDETSKTLSMVREQRAKLIAVGQSFLRMLQEEGLPGHAVAEKQRELAAVREELRTKREQAARRQEELEDIIRRQEEEMKKLEEEKKKLERWKEGVLNAVWKAL